MTESGYDTSPRKFQSPLFGLIQNGTGGRTIDGVFDGLQTVSCRPDAQSARVAMLIALHLGAHKTATTYIQKALEQSRETLLGSGVGCPSLDRIRSTITRRLNFARIGLGGATRSLIDEYRDCERVILSDENIIGGLRPPAGTKSFYARRRSRIGALVGRLRPNPVKIYLSTRSYDRFVSAIYCEYIRHNPFVNSRSYLSWVNLAAFSWIDVIATLVELVGAESVTMWRYEDLASLEDDVFGALTAGRTHLIDKPTARLRESMSVDAVEELAAFPAATHRAKEIRSHVKQIATALPKGPDRPAFSAFEAAEAEDLRVRYDEEMSGIEHRFPGITMLVPHVLEGSTSIKSK